MLVVHYLEQHSRRILNSIGDTGLILAVRDNQEEIVDNLLADPNIDVNVKAEPLHWQLLQTVAVSPVLANWQRCLNWSRVN